MGNPILGKEVGVAVKDGVVTVRYVGKYVDARSRARTDVVCVCVCVCVSLSLCVRIRAKQASARVEF